MSKTAKTRPLHVRIADGDLKPQAVHDHSHGECDLIALDDLAHLHDEHLTRCRWDFSYDGRNICGCPMCTDQDGRRAERRQSRHEARRETALLAEQYNTVQDVDDEASVLVH